MLIIEGSDSSGKSTFIDWIRENTNIGVIKSYYPKVNQLSYYLHSPNIYKDYFQERYYPSEMVYPRFKKNRVYMEDWKQYLIEAGLMQCAPVIIYLRPTKETIIEGLRARGDDYVSEDEVDDMLKWYDWVIERSHVPHVKYDFKKDDIEETIEKVMGIYLERETRYSDFRFFLSSGLPEPDGIMFIGDDPSDKSIGEGFIKAFISDKGSSAFLHESIAKAGIYDKEMPYFTNFKKGLETEEQQLKTLHEEIDHLQPRKIVCLGKDIHEKVGQGEYIEHPAYVKRFHSSDYDWYIDKLKNLL